MLDDSFSMTGQPWNDLKKCVDSFIDKLSADSDDSRLSVVVYNHNSRIVFQNEKIENTAALKNKINMVCGATNFEAPLRDADKISQSTH